MNDIKQNKDGLKESRKPYIKPKLKRYGTINQITQNTTMGKNTDGGTGKLSMRS